MLTGGVLVVAAVVIVMSSSSLGLDVESVALMGAASGAVVALVPDRSPQMRLLGFLVGFLASWAAYLLRAGLLPDTRAGHAVAVAFVVVVCTLVAALTRTRVPLWATLVGAAALTGSYETTYLEAPSQVLRTSTQSSTSVLLAVALGFFAAALVAPGVRDGETPADLSAPDGPPPEPAASAATGTPREANARLRELMEGDAR
jgi:hypothetical protein